MATELMSDEMLFRLAELIFREEKSQKEAAQILERSEATISRALQQCREVGIIQTVIRPPEAAALSDQVQKIVGRFGIRRSIVVHGGREGVGQHAATTFYKEVSDGDTVVVDGGLSLNEFVVNIPSDCERILNVIPIAADRVSYEASAYEMMIMIRSRFRLARCVRLPYMFNRSLRRSLAESQREAGNAKFIFLGAGPWLSGFTAHRFAEHLGLNANTISRRYPGLFALTGYIPLDCMGKEVRVKEIEESLPRAISYKKLVEIARRSDSQVSLLLSGENKYDALRSVILGELVNTLVIDTALARAFLQRSPSTF